MGQTIGYKTVAEWVKQLETRRWRSGSNNRTRDGGRVAQVMESDCFSYSESRQAELERRAGCKWRV